MTTSRERALQAERKLRRVLRMGLILAGVLLVIGGVSVTLRLLDFEGPRPRAALEMVAVISFFFGVFLGGLALSELRKVGKP